jgi:N-methylhydantoinase B/oxoprolinase/acetone carboxylase alpha subunit
MVSAAHPLSGLCGGDDASPYSSRFEVGTPNEYQVLLSANARLPAGAVIAYQHGGGAGFEPALLRDPAAVRDDVLDEIVSIARAREKYGVVLTGTRGGIRPRGRRRGNSGAATGNAMRRKRRRQRRDQAHGLSRRH